MLKFYNTKVKDINHLYYLIDNLKSQNQKHKIKVIDTIEELESLATSTANLSLFSNTINNNTTPDIIYILYGLELHDTTLKILKTLNTQVIFANCKIAKNTLNLQISPLPQQVTKRKNIYTAKNELQKIYNYQETQQILNEISSEDSDYYINTSLLEQLKKHVTLTNDKKLILKNITKFNANSFNSLDYLLNKNIPQALKFFDSLLKKENIGSILPSLLSQLRLIYIIKIQDAKSVIKDLRKNSFYITNLEKTSRSTSQASIYKLLVALLKFENNIRIGLYENPNNAFLLFIIKAKTSIIHYDNKTTY